MPETDHRDRPGPPASGSNRPAPQDIGDLARAAAERGDRTIAAADLLLTASDESTLGDVTAVRFENCTLDDAAVAWLVAAAGRLDELEVPRCLLGLPAIGRLVKKADLSRLRTLDLTENELGNAGAERIARDGERFAALERLDISWNELGDRGLEALLAGGFPKLAELRIAASHVTEPDFALLPESLRTLELPGNPLGEELLEDDRLAALASLDRLVVSEEAEPAVREKLAKLLGDRLTVEADTAAADGEPS